MIDDAISKLVSYALQTGLIQPCEKDWAVNAILDTLKLDSYADSGQDWGQVELAPVLEELLDDAHARGVLSENSVVYPYGKDPHDSNIRIPPPHIPPKRTCGQPWTSLLSVSSWSPLTSCWGKMPRTDGRMKSCP